MEMELSLGEFHQKVGYEAHSKEPKLESEVAADEDFENCKKVNIVTHNVKKMAGESNPT